MTIRIHTARLLELIGDLKHTTHPDPEAGAVHGILLHTARGYHVPGEPGLGDILVGTSSMYTAVGHTYVACSGQMTVPMLWPLDRAAHVASWFRAQSKDDGHTVEIGYDGKMITVKSGGDPTLFDDEDGDDQVEFRGLDVDKFPRGLWHVLEWDTKPGKDDGVPQARSDIPAAALDPFVKVAGKRTIEMYRYGPKRPILIGIGDRYRGALMPARWDDMDKNPDLGATPFGDVHDPELPEITQPQINPDSLLEMAADKILYTQIATSGALVRALKIKTGAAETLLDQLELLGVISEQHGDRGRDVLARKSDLGSVLDKIRAQQPQQPTLDDQKGSSDVAP